MSLTKEELQALEEQYKTAVTVDLTQKIITKDSESELEEFTVYDEETDGKETIFTTLEDIENNYTYLEKYNCFFLNELLILLNILNEDLIDSSDDFVNDTGISKAALTEFYLEEYTTDFKHCDCIYVPELDFYYSIKHNSDRKLIFNHLDNLFYVSIEHLINNGFNLGVNNKVIKIETILNINLSGISNYEIYKSCLDEFYKDKWDIIPITLGGFRKEYNLVIYYPEILITNSKDHKHTIKELYVIIPLILNNNYLLFGNGLYGLRSYQTSNECSAGYLHSHLNSSEILTIGQFCLGTGNINLILNNLKVIENFNELLFKGFLVSLEYYLTWESLEGGPHRKLESLFNKSNEIQLVVDRNFNTFYDSKLFKKYFENITPVYVNGVINYNFKDLENTLTNYFLDELEIKNWEKESLLMYNCICNYDCDTNKYYKISRSDALSENIYKEVDIVFRGNKLKGVIEVIKNKISTNTKLVANPQCTNYVKRKFTERIQSGFFEIKRDQEIRKTYSLD